MKSWFKKSYARVLVDNHITEDDTVFMTKFDPQQYVKTILSNGCEVCMVYACCHNGNCYYPSKVGHTHKNINGRDIFGQTISLLKDSGVTPIAYYTVVWHNQAAKDNPAWRLYDARGSFRSGRYWHCCLNNAEYREFTREQIREIVSYDVAGIFIDMTFWPGICYCSSCRERFKKECGLEMSTRIDWRDKNWVLLQRTRERWLNEFAAFLTECVRQQKPEMSVVHQFSPALIGWYLGLDSSFSLNSDYASGDFYGGKYQQRLGTKVMSAFSAKIPFEFMTSRCVNLYDHTSTKSEDELLCSAATTLANGGAYLFIDAINPDGTLEQQVHSRLGAVNSILKPYTVRIQAARPMLVSDVGLYFSMASYIEPKLNGTDLFEFLGKTSISNMESVTDIRSLKEVLGTSIVLNQLHQLYQVVNDKCDDLSSFKTIIINNAMTMSASEVDRLRSFVKTGGTLIITGETSLYTPDGSSSGDFAFADVMGISFTGRKTGRVNYLSNSEDGYVMCDYPSPLVKATTATVLAHVSKPFTDPDDRDHYASIHSNPPAPAGDCVALSVNKFGKGMCVYVYSTLMALRNNAQQYFTAKLFKTYLKSDFQVDTNAPACVEFTILQSTVNNNLLICFTNFQDELPNIAITDFKATIKLPAKFAVSKSLDSIGKADVTISGDGQTVNISVSRLETIAIIELELIK
ncbi:MAG: hypothetical protein UT30_C0029G0002 [Candidatus Uhrbacteria bacterium GW2011_GWF2_39_13]|uniref:Beta-galactosidase trimerisation domain-containing protein n=1 Tax=Candidatus Uhrbacteria bacterium GW2011_GWF2_39_13 TaxID=1618995 RepID=A0A0G0MHE0_9BACT|nr:MAG: hypothetical protein UT30_C0029G0002 [Candidatus Uhrbacteria bacterium GW2011_GWF2_39_13]